MKWLLLLSIVTLALASHYAQITTNNAGPLPRDTPTFAAHPTAEDYYLFGGVVQNFSTIDGDHPFGVYPNYNDLWKLHVENLTATWSQLSPNGPIPTARAFAKSRFITDSNGNHYMALYGGNPFTSQISFAPSTDIFYLYSLSNNTWINMTSVSPNPGTRSIPIVGSNGSRFYVSCGFDLSTFRMKDDIWEFDVNTLAWTQLDLNSLLHPEPRYGNIGGVMQDSNSLYFTVAFGQGFGETGIVQITTTWTFSFSTGQWSQASPFHNIPDGRMHSAGAISANRRLLALYGGDDGNGASGCGAPDDTAAYNDFWQFDVRSPSWEDVTASDANSVVPGLKFSVADQAPGSAHMLITGGFSFTCPGAGQVHNTGVYRIRNA